MILWWILDGILALLLGIFLVMAVTVIVWYIQGVIEEFR